MANAIPTVVDDSFDLLEDISFKANTGPLVELNFDAVIASGVIEDDWSILDQIENELGAGDDYPTDDSGREWNDTNFDTATSTLGPWFVAPVPIQSGGVDGFPGLDDELFGIGQAPDGDNLVTTYLFRNSFTLDSTEAEVSSWELSYLVDDGVAVYINGREVHRSAAIPEGELTTLTPAVAGANNENVYETAAVDLSGLLVEGNNSIAVELHQAGVGSSDVGFDLNIAPRADGGASSFGFIDDPFGAPFETSTPNNAAGDFDQGSGFEDSTAAHIRVGGGSQGQTTISSGSLRLPITLGNPATLEISFRYRLLMIGGYESGEYSAVILAVGDNFVGIDANDDIFRMYGPDGQGNEDSGWRTFSAEVSVPSGTHNLDFGVYNNASTTTGEVTDVWFDEILIEYEGGGSGGGVLENDTAEAGQLTAAIFSNPSHGTVSMNADGSFTYVPEEDFFGVDSFTYTATDDTGTSPEATVTLNVASVNDVPKVTDRSFSMNEDDQLVVDVESGLSVDSSDGEGEALSYAVSSDPSGGSLTINPDGSFEYTPDPNFEGTDTFTYVAEDGTDPSPPGTVTVSVSPVNDAPEAVADSYSVLENMSLVVSQSGANLPFLVLSDNFDSGAGSQFTGTVGIESVSSFESLNGFSGSFLINRTSGNPADETIITVNDLPPHDRLSIGFVLAIIDSWDGGDGSNQNSDFFTVTVDGESVFSHAFDNAGQGGVQSYIPPLGVELARSVDLGFSNDDQSLDSAYDLRAEPSLKNIPHVSDSVTIRIYANGGDWNGGDDESWAIDNFEVHALSSSTVELIAAGSEWRYLDDGSDQGSVWISADFDDGDWSSGPGELGYGDGDEVTTLSFGDDDDNKYATTYFRHRFEVESPDQFEDLIIGLLRDDGAAVYVNGNEVLRSNLDAGAGSQDFAGDFVGGEDESAYIDFPVNSAVLISGENVIAVEVHQSNGTSSDISFDLRFSGALSQSSGILGNDTDPDGPTLSASLLISPSNGTVNLKSDGSFTYIPNVNFEGNDSFEYTVSDGEFEDTGAVSITIEPGPNDVPIASGESYQATEDSALVIGVSQGVLENDFDPDGVDITAVLGSQPVNGTVELSNDGSFVYTPNKNFNGTDEFTYHVADEFGQAPPTVTTIEVSGINDAPVAHDNAYLTAPGIALDVVGDGLLVDDTDVDGDVLSAELLTSPDSGTIDFDQSGDFVYTPDSEFSGRVSFTYRVTDGVLFSDPVTVTVNVNASPVSRVNRFVVYEDGVLSRSSTFGILANDTDAEQDPLTAEVLEEPSNGSLNVRPDGGFTYIPDPDFSGLDVFTYAADDGYQISDSTQVLVYVIQVDDAPIATDDEYFVLIGQEVIVPPEEGVLSNDEDPEGNPPEAKLVDYTGTGTLTLNPDGSFEYRSAEGFAGKETFTYTAEANGKISNVAAVELRVGGPANTVVISEIMFHPSSENSSEEFIELRNIGSGPVPLQGWSFTSGVSFEFPAASIPSGGHVVVAADPDTFAATYEGTSTVIGPWSGQLSNRGERIRIVDALDDEVDDVTYSDQGDWAMRRSEDNGGEEGWQWYNLADGGGSSLELINVELSNKHGQNWAASVSPTPGAENSNSSSEAAPLVIDVKHFPAIPRSDETVTVSAKLKDNDGDELSGTLYWRVSATEPGPFAATVMGDNGDNGDVEEGDGTFSAQVPGQPDGSVIEFYVEASDGSAVRTWPGPSNDDGEQEANALFQFDDEVYTGDQPIYRLVMTVEEDGDFRFRNFNSGSDAQKNTTLIARQGSDYDIRYQCGVRVRGAGSRSRNPRNNRLNIPRDRPWNGVSKINLNTQFIYLQLLGSRLANESGIEAAAAKPIQLRYNGVNRADDNQNTRRYGSYLHLEPIDGDWADEHFPLDSGGNVYSKGRPDVKWDIRTTGDGAANANAYRSDGWSKNSNESIDDWEDLHQFMVTINGASGDDYLEQVSNVIDVEQWTRWFAYMTIVLSRETNLGNGTDDDYKFYGGVIDPRFKLIPHDFDTIFGLGDTRTGPTDSIFPAITNFAGQRMPQLDRFFNDPTILRLYYSNLRNLLETVFSKARFDAAVTNSLDWLPGDSDVEDDVIDFMDTRRSYILSQIPSEFTVSSSLSSSEGFLRTDDAGVTGLDGTIDPTTVTEVRVNGMSVPLDVRNGTWDGDQAGVSELLVSSGSSWNYLDDGSDQGTAWREPEFDDSAWSQGVAEFGYGDRGEVTEVSFGDDDQNKHITTYFRKNFEIADTDTFPKLTLRLVFDDGVAVFLNGVELVRANIEPDAGYMDLANITVTNAGFESFDVPAEALRNGSNTIAVEVHQRAPDSRDISFDAEIIGIGTVPLLAPGINQVTVEALDMSGAVVQSSRIGIWYDSGATSQVSEITEDTTWVAREGPYLITEDLVIPVDVTLSIEPGTSVYFANDTRMTVQGRLLAEGTDTAPINFSQEPGTDGGWEGIYFENTLKDNQVIYLIQDGSDAGDQSIEVAGSRVRFEKVKWTGTEKTILEVSHPQVNIVDCEFPSTSGEEVIHGEALDGDDFFNLIGNLFQTSSGYNDVIGFSGGRRPGPIICLLNNVFLGCTDDCLDLDGVDAHIEGNSFYNVHTDDPDRSGTSNAISTDRNSHLTIIRNLFHDLDHALLLKNNSDAIFENNTVVGATLAAISFDEPLTDGTVPGDAITLRGNIFFGNTSIFANQVSVEDGEDDPVIVADLNFLPEDLHGLGSGNLAGDPLFVDVDSGNFSLRAGSPAIGSGVNGADMGFDVRSGAIVSGEPLTVTRNDSATLTVHISGISGIEGEGSYESEYRWSLDDGAWSDPVPVSDPIGLVGLPDGSHFVEVMGKDSAGLWQAMPTHSLTWTVDSKLSRIVINEVLAENGGVYDHEGTLPDFIELWNDSESPRFVSGMVLSDRKNVTEGWMIPTGTVIPAGEFLVIHANRVDGTTGLHSGFALDRDGESIYLFDSADNGGSLIDMVRFGAQLNSRSIGRAGHDQNFALMLPTPGSTNFGPLPLGPSDQLKINEWLSSNGIRFDNDFVELYNPNGLPVSIGGMTLSDDPNSRPDRHTIAELSFVEAGGFVKFIADDDRGQGPAHLNFALSKLQDEIGLFNRAGEEIDRVQYANAGDDVSGGRITDGDLLFSAFQLPTPGYSNSADLSAEIIVLQNLRITELMYNPVPGSAGEYVKLENIGDTSINLGGVRFEEGIRFDFPDALLGPGESAFVVQDTATFVAEQGSGLTVLGEYNGKLDNGGERLRLEIASLSAGILDFEYDDNWYPETDGSGSSLVIVDPEAVPLRWGVKESWDSSGEEQGQSYLEWIKKSFDADTPGVTGKEDDPDSDGIPNLLEFVFALDPKKTDPEFSLPQLSGESGKLVLTYTTTQFLDELSVKIQVSDDLAEWENPGDNVSVELLTEDGIIRTYQATLNEDLGAQGSSPMRYMRLLVE